MTHTWRPTVRPRAPSDDEARDAKPLPPVAALPPSQPQPQPPWAPASRPAPPAARGRGGRLSTLLFGFALAVLLPALFLSAAAAWQAIAGQQAVAGQRLRDTARALALAVDREIAGVELALEAFAASPAFLPDPSAPDLAALEGHARRVADRLNAPLGVIRPDGTLLLATRRPATEEAPRLGTPALLERVFASGAPAVGDLATSSLTGRPALTVAVPVLRDWGGVALLAAAAVDADRLRGLLAAQGLPDGAFAAVSDSRGILVARSDAPPGSRLTQGPEEGAARLPLPADGTPRHAHIDGAPRVLAAHGIPAAPGWTLTVAAPADALAAAWRRPMLSIAAAGAGALLLGGGLALLAARRILRPVSRLREHALFVAGGGRGGATAASLPVAGVAELEELRLGFAAAEAALRAREAELAGVLEATGEGVVVLDREWRVAFISGRGAALIAGGRALRGEVIWEAFPESIGGPFWDAFRRSMAERVTATADAPWPASSRHLQAEAHPRADGGIVVFFRDVSEERAAASRLAESEARFRAMADNIPQLAWMARPDGWIFWYNQRWFDFTGTTPEEMEGWGWRSTHHPDHLDGVETRLRGAFATGEPWEDTFPMRGKDGAYRWFLTRARPVRNAAGRIALWFGTNTDITAQREAEAALAESEARLRLALEAGQVGTFSWDLRGGELVWDERMRALWALPAGAPVTGEGFRRGLHPEDAPAVRAAILAALDPRGTGRLELEARVIGQADGIERHVAAHGRVEFEEGRPLRMIGTATDVTQLRRAAQVLAREADQLEQLAERRGRALAESEARLAEAARMEALGRLAGGIAHDFNNVLQAVQGGLKLAEKRLTGDPGGVRRYLGLASDAAARGAAVTGRLLSFARRGALHAEAVAPLPLLEGLGEMLRHTIGPAITLRVEAPTGLPELWADRSQLEAVLVNLANNARDAMQGGGEIVLQAAAVRQAEASASGQLAPGEYLRLSVVDEGEGMPPEVLARVTEPFFTTKPKGQGTGLGLAMARGFAEQSGGALRIESAPGRGTTVSLWLPCASLAAPRGSGATKDSPAVALRSPATVLVAEDELEVREILVAELGERGFTVSAAGSGLAALELLDKGLRPDAVVTDLAMPGGMDGLGLIEEARRRLPRLPAVLVTGHAGEAAPERLEAVERGGPFALVRKPAAADVLAERLGRVLGQGRALPAAE